MTLLLTSILYISLPTAMPYITALRHSNSKMFVSYVFPAILPNAGKLHSIHIDTTDFQDAGMILEVLQTSMCINIYNVVILNLEGVCIVPI